MIEIRIAYFGLIAEKTGISNESIKLERGIEVSELRDQLSDAHPLLKDAYFRIAVDQELKEESFRITNDSEVALLPAFAGG